LLLAGATSPDWGPADVPAAISAQPALRVRAVPRSLRSALRRGLVVTVRGTSGRVTVTALAGRKRVAAGAARTSGRGAAAVRIRFDRSARRTLARRRAVKLTLKVTVTPATGRTSRAIAAVTLRR
jgi:hypothetical protein